MIGMERFANEAKKELLPFFSSSRRSLLVWGLPTEAISFEALAQEDWRRYGLTPRDVKGRIVVV